MLDAGADRAETNKAHRSIADLRAAVALKGAVFFVQHPDNVITICRRINIIHRLAKIPAVFDLMVRASQLTAYADHLRDDQLCNGVGVPCRRIDDRDTTLGSSFAVNVHGLSARADD